MGRTRRTSKILDKARVRSAGIRSVSPTLDLGNGLNVTAFEAAISTVQARLAAYNEALATIDQLQNELNAAEKILGDLSERMLAGIGARFGKDSSEYEQAGGKRKSERKTPGPKRKATPATP